MNEKERQPERRESAGSPGAEPIGEPTPEALPPFPFWSFLASLLILLVLLGGSAYFWYRQLPVPWAVPWHLVLLAGAIGWGLFVALYFVVHSGKHRQIRDLEKTATLYAGEFRETTGPLTWFLLFTYVGVGLWMIAYAVDRILRGLEYGHLGQ